MDQTSEDGPNINGWQLYKIEKCALGDPITDPYDTSLTHASPSFHTSGVDGRKHLMPVPCRLNVAQAVDGAHGLGRDHVPKEDLTRHATGGQNVIGSGPKETQRTWAVVEYRLPPKR